MTAPLGKNHWTRVATVMAPGRNVAVPLTSQDHGHPDPDHCKDDMVRLQPRTKTLLAWSLWLTSMGCCAGGLLAALLWVRPLTLGTLAGGAATR